MSGAGGNPERRDREVGKAPAGGEDTVQVKREVDVGNGSDNDTEAEKRKAVAAAGAAAAAAAAAAVAAAARPADERGVKRTRDEVETHPTVQPAAIYAPPSLYNQQQGGSGYSAAALHQLYDEPGKKAKQTCYKCGGDGHIAVMCPSRQGATEDVSAMQCRSCNGRGHMARECPSSLMKDQCFRCGQLGHRGRECPTMYGYAAPAPAAGYGPNGGYPAAYTDPYAASFQSHYGAGGHVPAAAAAPGMTAGYAVRPGAAEPYGSYPQAMGRGGFMRPPPGSGKCFRCNEEGHWTRDCPLKPPDSDPNGCYKCGRPGHRARDCNVCYKCMQPGHRAAVCPSVV